MKILSHYINEDFKMPTKGKIDLNNKFFDDIQQGDVIYYGIINISNPKIWAVKVESFEKVKEHGKETYTLYGKGLKSNEEVKDEFITWGANDKDRVTMINIKGTRIYSTSKEVLANMYDEALDEQIKKLQDKIDNIQKQIDDLLAQKENKFNF